IGSFQEDTYVPAARIPDDAARPYPGGARGGQVAFAEQRFDLVEPRVGLRRLDLLRIHPALLSRRALLRLRHNGPPLLSEKTNARCADRSADLAWPTSCSSTQVLAGWPLSVSCPSGRSCAVPHVCPR